MKKYVYILLALVVIGGMFYWADHIRANRPFVQKEVKIGVIAGTTGQYAAAGEGYLKGFNMAVAEWNNTHWNDPKSVKFVPIIEDDGFDAVKGLSAYKKLSTLDNVDAYAILSSFTIDAIYDLVHEERKPVALGFEQSKPAEDDNIFQVLPAARPIQVALGGKVKELGYKTPVAAVSNNTSVYQNFYEGFREGFGGNVEKFSIGSDVAGIRSQALAIVSKKPDVVAIFMAPVDGATLIKEILKISNNKPPYFVLDQSIVSGGAEYSRVLGEQLSKINDGLVSMSQNNYTKEFTEGYLRHYNEVTPPFGADMGYNSFQLLSQTYSDKSEMWIENMKRARFQGVDGEIVFDTTGLRVPNIVFGKLMDGTVMLPQ